MLYALVLLGGALEYHHSLRFDKTTCTADDCPPYPEILIENHNIRIFSNRE